MNKKLIAAAIAGAFVAPAAFAQNSTVQIYGLEHRCERGPFER